MTQEEIRLIVAALVPMIRHSIETKLEHERTAAALVLETALRPLGERVASLEARPATPGPPGEKGAPGEPGAPGKDGVDGRPGLEYCGVFVDGKTYARGHCVTWAGSLYHCNVEASSARPGDGSREWTLAVKRGADGKAGRP